MVITEPTVLIPGLTARRNSTRIVAVDLHYSADPLGMTDEKLEMLADEMGGRDTWRWRKEMELDPYAQAGEALFLGEWLDWQRRQCCNPIRLMDVDPAGSSLAEHPSGKVKTWLEPRALPKDLPELVESAERTFGIGMDVGAGTGASDSTIVVMCAQGFEQAAEFKSNRILPWNLGLLAVAVAHYFNDALICCVQKMHGSSAIRAMVAAGYTRLWRTRVANRIAETPTKNLGWPHGEIPDKLLYDRWAKALSEHATILHGVETVEQHRQYVFDEEGRPCFQRHKGLNPTARQQHADLVVAAALAYRACRDLPKFIHPVTRLLPQETLAGRREQWRRTRTARDPW
jgi:hypothetical protein